MSAERVEREFKGLGESDQVVAEAAFGDSGAHRCAGRGGRASRTAWTVELTCTQNRPPTNSGHKSIRIGWPIRFAEMRGIPKFRRGRKNFLCTFPGAEIREGFTPPSPLFA